MQTLKMIKATKNARRTLDNLIEKGNYVVFLPDGVRVNGYEKVPKIAETHAGSEREAVSHILFRRNGKEVLNNNSAKIVMSILDKQFGGAERYAVLIPEMSEYDLIDYVLADELAAKNGSDDSSDYVQKARFLLKGVGRLS